MEPLIYIEQKEKDEATLLLKGFTSPNLRKRVFINALGAELLMKYLAQEGINVANVYNMHNIFKIREEFDVADVMLPNIHIDVRVVYDKDIIFVPKSHFENNLVPDVYVVFNMAQDAAHVDFLGFIQPKNIDKSRQNSEYYFIDKEQLVHPFEFVEFVKNFDGNTTEAFSDDLYNNALALIDNDISDTKKHELINALKKSSALREEMIEFDNFEWLSYNASKEDIIDTTTSEMSVIDEFDLFEEKDEFGFEDDNSSDETDENEETENPEESEEEVSSQADNSDTTDVSDLVDLADISAATEVIDVASDISDDIEPSLDVDLSVPEDLSIDFANEEELKIDETTDMPELEVSDENNTEDISAEELTELVDIPETPAEDIVEQNNFEIEEGGFTEELENLTEIVEPMEILQEETNEINEPEASENTEELVDLVPLSTEDSAEEISNNAEELTNDDSEEMLEELTPLEEMYSESDDSDKDMNSESVEYTDESFEQYTEEQPVEIEADNNSVTDIPETYETVQHEEIQNDTPQMESFESSSVISSRNLKPGEIKIDINEPEQEEIGVLYDNNIQQNIENEAIKTPEKGKKAAVVAAAAAVVIAASATYFVVSNKQSQVTETPIAEEQQPPAQEQSIPEEDTVVKEMPTESATESATEVTPAPAQPQPIVSEYIDIKRMGWSVPDYVTYNDNFKHYLQTLGKSIKLALSSDLLLATEYPYSDQIYVNIVLWNSGSVKDIKISQSSGSKQIDDIVLRTVNQTVNAVKPPAGVIVGDNFHMTLKIYL